MTSIEARTDFSFVRYANCWEDADILTAALKPGPGRRILSIASAGDNSLMLLAGGPEVVAVDINPAQLDCLELRREAIRSLDHGECLAFLGIRPASDRLRTFDLLESGLSKDAREFWEANRNAVASGIVHFGKFENYFKLFRTRILPLIHGKSTVRKLLAPKSIAERIRFYQQTWANLRWFLLFRLFFSRIMMGRLGRDPEFFRYVDVPVSERILRRTEYALTALPTHDNPYLDFILAGNFTRNLPPYLGPRHYRAIRKNLDRLQLFRGTVQEAAKAHGDDGFDGFNLSDIFEYLDPVLCETVYTALLRTARPGARLAYWNMLAPRQAPESCRDRVIHLASESADLHARDRAFFYSDFRIEAVR